MNRNVGYPPYFNHGPPNSYVYGPNPRHEIGCMWEIGPEGEYMELDEPELIDEEVCDLEPDYRQYYVQNQQVERMPMYRQPRTAMTEQQIEQWQGPYQNPAYARQNQYGNYQGRAPYVPRYANNYNGPQDRRLYDPSTNLYAGATPHFNRRYGMQGVAPSGPYTNQESGIPNRPSPMNQAGYQLPTTSQTNNMGELRPTPAYTQPQEPRSLNWMVARQRNYLASQPRFDEQTPMNSQTTQTTDAAVTVNKRPVMLMTRSNESPRVKDLVAQMLKPTNLQQ